MLENWVSKMDGGGSSPLKVLVADDAKLVRLLIIDLLQCGPCPVSVTKANNGTDACRHLLSGEFDIAFIDVGMPGIDGLAALELAHRMNSQTFVIIISTEVDETKLKTARRFRAYEFLKKPFTAGQVTRLLENYQRIRNNHRVLVVDDSATVRRIVEKILKKSFFKIDIEDVGDGQSTIDVCGDRKFDIVLLDVNMPGMSGIEALRQIRKNNNATKVILMTAQKDFELTDDVKHLEIETVLYKPFSTIDIDKCLHESFGIEQPRLNA